MVDEGDSDDEDAALAKPLLRSQQLQRLALTGGDSMYVPVRLDWLAAAPQLQHLTACVVQSGQVGTVCIDCMHCMHHIWFGSGFSPLFLCVFVCVLPLLLETRNIKRMHCMHCVTRDCLKQTSQVCAVYDCQHNILHLL
jgi:hypothetical protein